LDKKPVFLVMDYLLTGFVVTLICLAAWLFYKRWVGRYRAPPPEDDYEEFEPEPEPPVAKKPAPAPEPIPEPGTSEEK